MEQFNSLKTDQLASLESAFNKLEEEELPDCQDIVESFKEAYSQLARKVCCCCLSVMSLFVMVLLFISDVIVCHGVVVYCCGIFCLD